jgi:hypothetical protein
VQLAQLHFQLGVTNSDSVANCPLILLEGSSLMIAGTGATAPLLAALALVLACWIAFGVLDARDWTISNFLLDVMESDNQ